MLSDEMTPGQDKATRCLSSVHRHVAAEIDLCHAAVLHRAGEAAGGAFGGAIAGAGFDLAIDIIAVGGRARLVDVADFGIAGLALCLVPRGQRAGVGQLVIALVGGGDVGKIIRARRRSRVAGIRSIIGAAGRGRGVIVGIGAVVGIGAACVLAVLRARSKSC